MPLFWLQYKNLFLTVNFLFSLQMFAYTRVRPTFRDSPGSLTAVPGVPVRTLTMVTTGVTMPAPPTTTCPPDVTWSTREESAALLSTVSQEFSTPLARTSTPSETEDWSMCSTPQTTMSRTHLTDRPRSDPEELDSWLQLWVCEFCLLSRNIQDVMIIF